MSIEPQMPKATVLAVDDEPAMLDIFDKFLGKAGYKIIPARCVKDAIDLFAKGEPNIDLLLCDYNLPDMNGDQLAETLTAIRPSLPVVFISGGLETRERLLARGFGYVEKPFLLLDLLTAVKMALKPY